MLSGRGISGRPMVESLQQEGAVADDDIQSLITDEHRASIGVKSDPITVTVKQEDAERMYAVVGDTDRRWAPGSGDAPPYVIAALGARPAANRTRVPFPQVLPNGLLTQQEWRWSRRPRVGETLVGTTQVVDIRDRLGGRYGYSVLVTSSTDYADAAGDHVCSVLTTVTQFDPKRVQQGGGE